MRVFRLLAIAALAGVLTLPAFADIKAFNAAVIKGDYKAAASAAAETWPQLDKARPDIDTIAREFGFAAFMAEDFAAAEGFAQAAADRLAQPGASSEFLEQTDVLLRMSQHQRSPSSSTRDLLSAALVTRVAKPGFDNISLRGANALVAYDMNERLWNTAAADSAVAIKIAKAGGPGYLSAARTFELYAAVSGFLAQPVETRFLPFLALQEKIMADIAQAPNDEAARRFLKVYWTSYAWDLMVRSSRARKNEYPLPPTPFYTGPGSERVRELVGERPDEILCRRLINARSRPDFPKSAYFKNYMGTVVLEVDIDANGRASNPVLLASVPEEYFADAVLKMVPRMLFSPGKGWDSARCHMATTRHRITYDFLL